MAAVTEDDNPGQLPVAGEEAADAAASGELAGEAGDQAGAAHPGEPDARAEPDDAAAAPGVDEDEDEAPDADEDGEALEPSRNVADLEQESEIAADYVEGLLDVADLDGDIDMDVEGDRALVSVVGATLQELVGPRGEVQEALQVLTRLSDHRQQGARTSSMHVSG